MITASSRSLALLPLTLFTTTLVLAAPVPKLVGHHATGKQPTTVTILDGGAHVAVVNRGDESVWMYDARTMDVIAKYSLVGQHGAWGAAPWGSENLLVANWSGETISVLNRRTGAVVGVLPTGIKPSYIAVNAAGTRAYAAGNLGGDVAVIDLQKRELLRLIDVGQKPMGVVLSPDERWLYVAACKSFKIAKIDLKYDVVLDNLPAPLAETTNLAITPDGTHLLAAGKNNKLLLIDTEGNRTVKIKVGPDPAGVTLAPDGRTAFVAQYGGSVGVVDIVDGVMTKQVQVARGCIDVATDGRRLYSVSDQGAVISVFDLESAAAIDIPPARVP